MRRAAPARRSCSRGRTMDDAPETPAHDTGGTGGMADSPRHVSEHAGESLAKTPLGRRAHHMLWMEFGSREDFEDPRHEHRRLFSELLGTFFLVLVAAGGAILHARGQISLAAAVVAPGLMVMAIILFMGAISGAHLNPAVSVAFALRNDFPWRRVPGYLVVQLGGAALAAWFLQAVIHVSATFGSNYPAA